MTPAEIIAAVAPIADRIQPPNATRMERAFLAAELGRFALVDPQVIATIWNPWLCPEPLLAFLAYGVSVDVWSDAWPEQQKRQVIAASPMIHRLKGTTGAVRRALAAFDLEAHVVEWWQDSSRRGTFRIEIVYRNGSPVYDAATQGYAIRAVQAAKPKSRVFTTRAVVQAGGQVYVGARAASRITAVAHPFVFSPPTLRATNYVAAHGAAILSATAHYKKAS